MRFVRQSLRVVSLAAVAWAGTVAITGGFRLRIGPLRVSSQRPDTALIVALAAVVAFVAATWLAGSRAREEEWAWWRRAASRIIGWPRVHARDILDAVPALLAMVLVGVRVWHWTAARPMWLDEEGIALIVRERSFAHLGAVWMATSAPLGWLIVERSAILVAGTGEAVLRLLPMLFGIAMLGTAVGIGRRWMSPIGATALVLLCGTNFFLALYWLQAKQYSADACWALVLPAMAVWAIEADTDARRIRRAAAWWVAATMGQWLANGAAIVTPGCALILFAASWRRGRAVAGAVAAFGLIWVGGALLHYQLSMRDTLNNPYFHNYWIDQFPPSSIGPMGALRWMFGRLDVLAASPGGTGLWISLWILAACGFAFGSPPMLGLVFATVPLTAFLLAGLRIVPLFERFVLWMVPALAIGLALILDRAVRAGREAAHRHHWLQLAIAVVIAAGVVRVCADVVFRGRENFRLERPGSSNHGLDDRAAVRWLMAQRHPGDAIVAPPLAWPAVWWYGDIPIGDDALAHGTLKDGGPMLKVTPEESGAGCDEGQLRAALQDQRRVLVYIGFPGFPAHVGDLILQRLEELGSPAAARRFAEFSRAEVIEIRPAKSPSDLAGRDLRHRERLSGCVGVQPAIPQ